MYLRFAGPRKHKVNKEIRFMPLWCLIMGDSFLVIFWGLELMPAYHMMAPGGCLLNMIAPKLPPWTKAISFEIRLKILIGLLEKAFSEQGPGMGVCGWWKVGTEQPNGHRSYRTKW